MSGSVISSFIDLSLLSSGVVEKGRVRKKPRFKIKDLWEALALAAKKKRKCLLRYKKRKRGGTKEYLVAPYSFRDKPGGEVLFAYDFLSGRIKSFFKDGVTGVHMLSNRFRPRWDVELSFHDLAELLKVQSTEEFMHDGRAAQVGIKPEDVDQEQLEMGTKVEFEHTDDVEIARKIVLDHLAEFSTYYTSLKEMENKLREEQKEKK